MLINGFGMPGTLWSGYFTQGHNWQTGLGNSNEDNENVVLNDVSYMSWLYRFLDIALSVFEWHNLPDGVDERMLELWLLTNGYCIFFHDDDLKYDEKRRAPEGYAVLQGVATGKWDIYNYPEERRVFAPNGFLKTLTDDNSVIIFNDRLRAPVLPTICLYARRIAEIDRTIDINVMNQKAPKIMRTDDKQKLSFRNLAAKVMGNVYTILVDKNMNLKDVEVLDMTTPFVGEDMDRLKRRYVSECMTFLGVEGANTDKKERLISAEILRGMGDVEAMRFTRLTARQQACKEINELFGLDVDVTFRSGIYIRANDSSYEPTTGMGVGNTGIDIDQDTTGYEGAHNE